MARHACYDRDEVLQKALALFWAKGYQGTSLKDLETALNMRPGSIYAAFGSKEKLFLETLRLYARTGMAQLRRLTGEMDGPLAALAAHVRGLGCATPATVPSRACMLVKTVLETPDDDPVLRREAETLIRQLESAFADAFRAAKARGDLPPDADPDRMASRLQAQIFGLRAYAQRSDGQTRTAQIAEDIARDIEALATLRPGPEHRTAPD